MAEYIKREDVLREYDKEQRRNGPWRFETLIESIPAADVVQVVHGRWKYFQKKNIAVCTNCSFERNLYDNFGRAVSCPNCGARMAGERKDNG